MSCEIINYPPASQVAAFKELFHFLKQVSMRYVRPSDPYGATGARHTVIYYQGVPPNTPQGVLLRPEEEPAIFNAVRAMRGQGWLLAMRPYYRKAQPGDFRGRMLNYISDWFDPFGPLIITGLSRGGHYAIELCRFLEKNCAFVTISYASVQDVVPDAVRPFAVEFKANNDGMYNTFRLRVDLLAVGDASLDGDVPGQRQVPANVRRLDEWYQTRDMTLWHGPLGISASETNKGVSLSLNHLLGNQEAHEKCCDIVLEAPNMPKSMTSVAAQPSPFLFPQALISGDMASDSQRSSDGPRASRVGESVFRRGTL